LFELQWAGAPFADLDLEIARGDNEIVFGGPLGSIPRTPVLSGGRHEGNNEASSAGVGAESVRWTPSFPPDHYLVRVITRNDALTTSQVKVTRDPGPTGANEVLANFTNIGLSGTNQIFQMHVAAPAGLATPPPPLPTPPPPSQLPPPLPGPNDSSQMVGAAAEAPRSARVRGERPARVERSSRTLQQRLIPTRKRGG
jgi:hypothetical protein